jgi:hypothetical protein
MQHNFLILKFRTCTTLLESAYQLLAVEVYVHAQHEIPGSSGSSDGLVVAVYFEYIATGTVVVLSLHLQRNAAIRKNGVARACA